MPQLVSFCLPHLQGDGHDKDVVLDKSMVKIDFVKIDFLLFTTFSKFEAVICCFLTSYHLSQEACPRVFN